VHDETDAGLAFHLSRLSHGPTEPTPVGIFRSVSRPDYGSQVNGQLASEVERKGPGDLAKLLRSGATWEVA
jgi:2-oxoglutarate ferredoxin oxidoreductase subunit beta